MSYVWILYVMLLPNVDEPRVEVGQYPTEQACNMAHHEIGMREMTPFHRPSVELKCFKTAYDGYDTTAKKDVYGPVKPDVKP